MIVSIGIRDTMGYSQETVLMGLFVQMLDRHEQGLVDLVIWYLGFRIGDVVLSWRRNIHRLVKALKEIPESGWRTTKASYRRRGELIRDKLEELNGGIPLFESGPLVEGDRMLRFVQEMVLPWGRMQLRRKRELTLAEMGARDIPFQMRQVAWFKWYVNYQLPIDLDKEHAVRHKVRTCSKCAYQGFELTRALIGAVPGGQGTVRILWALLNGADASKNNPYRRLMKEFDEMVEECCKNHWDDDPKIRAADKPPGGMWLAAQSIGKPICCDAWKYSPILRKKRKEDFAVKPEPIERQIADPNKYGLYGVNDMGMVCTSESVFGCWRHNRMEWYAKPVPWEPSAEIRFVN